MTTIQDELKTVSDKYITPLQTSAGIARSTLKSIAECNNCESCKALAEVTLESMKALKKGSES